MGIIAQGKNLWDALFTRTQRQVLSLLFGYPERSFFANEVVRLAGVGTGSVQRELAKLSACGLLTVTRIGNQKHYQANPKCPIFSELRGIVLKTYGALDQLRGMLEELGGNIRLALIYGPQLHESSAQTPDLQMLIVADGLEYADIVSRLTGVENRIGRTVQLILLGVKEFESLQREGNEIVLEVLRQPVMVLAGGLD
jgi:DNA-binding MarR family transcriptional regulator